MIREFKEASERQRKQDADMIDINSGGVGEVDATSISDIDFNQDQKKTNNFLGSFAKNHKKDENEETADVNKAVIFKSSNSKGHSEETSNLGSFCQQLNNTSFFAGNNMDNLGSLPENMDDLFNKEKMEDQFDVKQNTS